MTFTFYFILFIKIEPSQALALISTTQSHVDRILQVGLCCLTRSTKQPRCNVHLLHHVCFICTWSSITWSLMLNDRLFDIFKILVDRINPPWSLSLNETWSPIPFTLVVVQLPYYVDIGLINPHSHTQKWIFIHTKDYCSLHPFIYLIH